jgi:hypothetical protein
MNQLVTGLILVAAVGCTSRKDIREAHEIVGEEVTVATRGGRTTAQVQSTGGKVTYVADGIPLASSDVVSVSHNSRGKGAAQGLTLGFGAGFVTGVALHASGRDECDRDHECVDLLGPVFTGIVIGGLGGLVGLVVGTVAGSTTVYESKRGVTVQVGGPSGSTAGLTVKF